MDLQVHVKQQVAAAGVAQHVVDDHQGHPGAGFVRHLVRFAQQQADALCGQPHADHRDVQLFPDAQRLQAAGDQDRRAALDGGLRLLHRALCGDAADLGNGIMAAGLFPRLADQILLGQQHGDMVHKNILLPWRGPQGPR